MRKYLPAGEPGTVYSSQYTATGMYEIEEHKRILKRKGDCVYFEVTITKDDKKESEYIDKLCATQHLLYRSSKSKPLINIKQRSWIGMQMLSKNQIDDMRCSIFSLEPFIFDDKKINAVTTECKAENTDFFITFAEGLGIAKVDQKVGGYGTVGGMKLKKIVYPKTKR